MRLAQAAPRTACLRAGQTRPALFFSLRLNPQTMVGGHCRNDGAPEGARRR
jgi:hypothetical protein